MVIHIVTPEVMKEWVDSMVKQGAKAFVVSTDLHGTASIPSKKCQLYRVPMCIGADVFKDQNLSRVINGSRLVLPVVDIDWLSEDAQNAMQKKKGV